MSNNNVFHTENAQQDSNNVTITNSVSNHFPAKIDNLKVLEVNHNHNHKEHFLQIIPKRETKNHPLTSSENTII